jgi:hypothetical protein
LDSHAASRTGRRRAQAGHDPVEPPPADAIERRTAEASKQRIVALRLVATGEGWAGRRIAGRARGGRTQFRPVFDLSPRARGRKITALRRQHDGARILRPRAHG